MILFDCECVVNKPNQKFPPHRAKLVQIPDNSVPTTITTSPILSTSQFKFPRKSTIGKSASTTTVPLSSYTNFNFESRSNPPSPPPSSGFMSSGDVPIQIAQTPTPNYKIPKTYLKAKTDEAFKKNACLYLIFF